MIIELLIIFLEIIIIALLVWILWKKKPKENYYTKTEFLPIGINGKLVDWWAIIKLPSGYSKTDNCEQEYNQCNVQQVSKIGLAYLYADSNHPSFVLQNSDTCLNQDQSPVEATVRLMETADYVIWNDDGSNIGGGCVGKLGNAPLAHSKGMAALHTNQGIIMNVSTPNFATPASCSQRQVGCQKDNNVIVCQHYFCFSVDAQNFDTWVANVKKAALIIQDQSPQFPIANLSYDCHTGKEASNMTSLTTLGGQPMDVIIKSCSFDKSPWTMVSDFLKKDLYVLSWYAYPYEDPSDQLTRISTLKVDDFIWNGLGSNSPTGNHSKIAVTKDLSYIIFGSMNMQTSQAERGGDFYALPIPELAKSFYSLVTETTTKSHCELGIGLSSCPKR